MPIDDGIYWNSIDFGSDGNKSPYSRKYVDPWDLENYAYIREHLNDHSADNDFKSDSNNSVQFSGENDSTSFYYTPERHESKSKDYCAIDEVKYDVQNGPNKAARDFRRGQPTVFTICSTHQDGMAIPIPDDDFKATSKHGFSKKHDLPERYLIQNSSRRNHSSSEARRESTNRTDFQMRQKIAVLGDEVYPKHKFDLSNYGHLKIDYSYNWNNLDKYICN